MVDIHDLKVVNELPREPWSEFVYHHPQGNIFQTPEMNDVWNKTRNNEPYLLAMVDKDGRIHGLLQGVIQKEYGGFLGKLSARSIIWGGPLVKDNRNDVLETILCSYTSLVNERAIYTQIRNLFPVENVNKIFKKAGFQFDDHLDILINLDKPVNILWKELHSNRRKQINRGYRRGVSFGLIDIPDEKTISECYEIIATLYKKIKLPLPKKEFFFNSIYQLSKNIGLFILKFRNKIIGCRFVLMYKKLIYDWYAGSCDHFLDKYPNDILPWEIMKWGAENGYKVFDFGGAGKPGISYGVRDYKLKFGGELINYGRFQKIHSPLKMKIAENCFKIWRLLKK